MRRSFESYRPGTHKLMHHLGHLQKMGSGLIVAPLHVSVWPTLSCQCRCEYCCCRNEAPGQPDLSWEDFKVAIDALAVRGTKAVEFAGGGEPLLWKHFREAVHYVHGKGLKISLITNGIELGNVPYSTLVEISWIRVSLQSVEHARMVEIGHVPPRTRVSASVIYSPGIDFAELHRFVKARSIVTRIASPQPSTEQVDRAVEGVAEKHGKPFFFAEKPKGTPPGCYMAWVRAAIDWTGHFLPCPAIMLSDDSGKVQEAFRLCHVKDLGQWLDTNTPRDLGFRCAFCNCGKEHNELIHNILEGVEHDEFV